MLGRYNVEENKDIAPLTQPQVRGRFPRSDLRVHVRVPQVITSDV